MNLERISDALQTYTGQEESMQTVVAVLQEELGENWLNTVFDDLQGLPPALKDNLSHVYQYYAATLAWNEIQEYLAQDNLTKTPELEERLPILHQWMEFFGEPGLAAYQELANRLEQSAVVPPAAEDADATPTEEAYETMPTENVAEEVLDEPEPETQDWAQEPEPEETEAEIINEDMPMESQETADESADDEDDDSVVADPNNSRMSNESAEPREQTPEMFEIEKLQNQMALLDQNEAWLAARCIQLKGIEVFAYPFYGYLVDMMRQIMKGIQAIEENETAMTLLDTMFEGGQEEFERKKQAIQHEIDLAEQNCESNVTALISDEMDMDEVKKTLGTIDESDTVEYVGPAPDGFELVDEETPLDETAIKQQYEKLENMDAMTGTMKENPQTVEKVQEGTSQNEQKGVQRKLSFSLKRKKPTEGT